MFDNCQTFDKSYLGCKPFIVNYKVHRCTMNARKNISQHDDDDLRDRKTFIISSFLKYYG